MKLAPFNVEVNVQKICRPSLSILLLMKQALINVLHNSTVYSPTGSGIIINCYLAGDKVEVPHKGRW